MHLTGVGLLVSSLVAPGCAQVMTTAGGTGSQATPERASGQTAQIFGLDEMLQRLGGLQAARGCGTAATLEELTLRQQLSEGVQTASLDVDSVLAELSNEQGKLADLRTTLQTRRDATVARLNTVALITGALVGAAVSGTQFTTLGTRTNNIGDGVGIGSGVASTVLSVMATRKQKGPDSTVGRMPNMLAPLFDRAAVLNTFYPAPVVKFLESVPANNPVAPGTRLEQLKARWGETGRLGAGKSGGEEKITALTSSGNADVKVAIGDLTDRIAMLTDVAGLVSLIKRDLAVLMRSYQGVRAGCAVP